MAHLKHFIRDLYICKRLHLYTHTDDLKIDSKADLVYVYLLDRVIEDYLLTNIEYGKIAMVLAGNRAILSVPHLNTSEDVIE